MLLANSIHLLQTVISSIKLSAVLMLAMATSANAASIFTFDSDANGWSNQATEPFLVTFAPGEGFEGGGALAISATTARDRYQIVHDEDPVWPTTPSFGKITFDVRLEPGVMINYSGTGMQIRDNVGNESNVYLATDIVDLGGGWTRVISTPTALFDLPGSHDDFGLNLHISTTQAFTNTRVTLIDNITMTPVPEPSLLTLFTLGAFTLLGYSWLRGKPEVSSEAINA